jgi:predicted nucleic acid-binding protein
MEDEFPAAYWDSSALIPLCVTQPQSTQAILLYERYNIVAWWATQVEIISGLTRLERMGQITHNRFLVGKQFAQDLVRGWISAGSSKGTAVLACSLLELYPLRAGDALQLAVALEVSEHRTQGYPFITADDRLADAARRSGFSVEFI